MFKRCACQKMTESRPNNFEIAPQGTGNMDLQSDLQKVYFSDSKLLNQILHLSRGTGHGRKFITIFHIGCNCEIMLCAQKLTQF